MRSIKLHKRVEESREAIGISRAMSKSAWGLLKESRQLLLGKKKTGNRNERQSLHDSDFNAAKKG